MRLSTPSSRTTLYAKLFIVPDKGKLLFDNLSWTCAYRVLGPSVAARQGGKPVSPENQPFGRASNPFFPDRDGFPMRHLLSINPRNVLSAPLVTLLSRGDGNLAIPSELLASRSRPVCCAGDCEALACFDDTRIPDLSSVAVAPPRSPGRPLLGVSCVQQFGCDDDIPRDFANGSALKDSR
ncbi:hypothetical protein G7046_g2557 [Stylonectria norvegica]|nr:hypothetical protein G7046_g2557 [Stylonectria norvegica]